MTLRDIERSLPYGFENANLRGIDIRYDNREVDIRLDVVIYKSGGKSRYEPLSIRLRGLVYVVVEPPHSNYFDDYLADGAVTPWVSATEAHRWPGSEAITDSLSRLALPDGAFRFRLLVHDWNSYIHFAAMEATAPSLSYSAEDQS